jgi:hypothetical protein
MVFFFLQICTKGGFSTKSPSLDFRWVWITRNNRGTQRSNIIWVGHGHVTFTYFTCIPTIRCDLLQMLQPYFEGNVRMKLTLPKLGLGSFLGLLKLQRSMAGVKTPHIEVFFISLESYWSVDVEYGLALAIWISAAQVMAKRRVESQTASLTPDH